MFTADTTVFTAAPGSKVSKSLNFIQSLEKGCINSYYDIVFVMILFLLLIEQSMDKIRVKFYDLEQLIRPTLKGSVLLLWDSNISIILLFLVHINLTV